MAPRSLAHAERRLLAAGATLAVFGIATSTGELSTLASVLTLGGLVLLMVGLHRFGRVGPDPALANGSSAEAAKSGAEATKATPKRLRKKRRPQEP
ncbi:MAG TPA: hypothetical protein VFU02_05015 [Polyangiaceae bacterium]|nr:hypothetical protein [Polyangiaceae bacterium]